jgi:thioredoxin 1
MKKFLYFSAEWCGPCKMLGPVMEELNSEGYEVQKIDVDSNPELSQQFGIRNIPTVVLTIDNVDSGRKVGSNPKQSYIEMYNAA